MKSARRLRAAIPSIMLAVVTAATIAAGLNASADPAAQDESCAPAEKFGPGLFSTDDKWEWRITFSPLRRTAYWTVSDGFFPATRQSTIVTSRFRDGAWTPAEVAPFSGVYPDIDPFITPDGRTLFFSSIRPVRGEARSDTDIWMVRRTLTGWSDPIHLGDTVNGPTDELYPSADFWGNLYFGRFVDGDWDIYRSRRGWDGRYTVPERLGPSINTAERWEFNPEISPDGRTLLFVRLEAFAEPWSGIHFSHQRHNTFTPSQPLDACVNTAADEYHPTMLWERDTLIFVRNPVRAGSNGDFYKVHLRIP